MEYIVFTFYSEIVLLVGIRGSKHRILRGQMGDPAVNFLSFNFFTFYDKGGMEIRLKWVRKFVEIIIFNIVVKRKKRIKEIRIPTNKRTIIQYKNCQIPSDIRLCFSLGVLDTS